MTATEKATGAVGIGTSAVPSENRTPTLADLGIDKKTSARVLDRLRPYAEVFGDDRGRVYEQDGAYFRVDGTASEESNLPDVDAPADARAEAGRG